ncbi:hypothetical protein [Mycobacterium sp.]|uniref:hypothetical protein n=1 Tax=Mycobacterium sp. TaxID=1785 RepID=UPI003BAF4034
MRSSSREEIVEVLDAVQAGSRFIAYVEPLAAVLVHAACGLRVATSRRGEW